MPVYETVKREGNVFRVSECMTCKLRDACPVSDERLRIWKDWSMGCVCYTPESVYGYMGNCSI